MIPAVFFAWPDMSVPLRVLPIHRYKLGTDVIVDLDVVVTQDIDECRIGTDLASALLISSNGGASYDAVPVDVESGPDLGSQVAGARVSVKLKVSIASGVRRRFIALNIGVGS